MVVRFDCDQTGRRSIILGNFTSKGRLGPGWKLLASQRPIATRVAMARKGT